MSRVLILCAFIFFLSGCEEREEIKLQGGYEIIRVYGDAHSIATPDGRELVMPNVVSAKDDSLYIIGRTEAPVPAITLPEGLKLQPYGYFIFEKGTGVLSVGLSLKEFQDKLLKENISLKLEN
ncbi:hypothetical protein [Teredinibacter sp. KSP-S5-2]|uniref:hypothetical protein n=1 Tax=Teredinibacter sp. KSP-S5-2 TaxID=3034506 RepID=UPI0029346046|nr:hypothetical protein [Teredinibacter sp. KSP-S5-2]WNO11240.1 hypothetical protein P5V12_08645 [Teredinibacter sp. KSP-S5-2]